jgi:RNA polymerase sigma-70 factor (ECF subfamily)
LRLVSRDGSTDRHLCERIRKGDVDAFECVFRSYFAPLCIVANGYVRAPDVAEELVQDLLLTVWDQRATIELRDSLRVYLFRAARNRALNSVRRTRREIAWTREVVERRDRSTPAVPSAHEGMESRQLAAAIAAAVAELPERRRLAFQLTQQAGLSHAEAAAVMGIATKTIAIHLGLARETLRDRLGAFLNESGA